MWFADTFGFIPFIGGTVTGPNYFIAGLILAIMILPIASAISREVISTVPREHKEAALALGATRWEMIRMAVIPYARGGIAGGAMLGLGRAIGETIAVTLVIGNAPVIGDSIFQQGYTLAAVIANEFGEAASNELHRAALIARRARAVRADARRQRGRARVRDAGRARAARRARSGRGDGGMSAVAFQPVSRAPAPHRQARARARRAADRRRARAARADPLLPDQAGHRRDLARLLHDRSDRLVPRRSGRHQERDPGHRPDGPLASAVAVPVGVGVAIWLVEFGRESKLAHAVRYFIDVMTGVPSIVFGLFVYITLVVGGFGGSSFAAWKGSIALALLMLPIVTRSAEVVLLLVPNSLREAAYALGAPRWKVVFRVVLPTALPGIVTGVLLAVARAAGETAPLLFTAAAVNATAFDYNDSMNSLPMLIFKNVGQAQDRLVTIAWGAALTLVAMILMLTLLARLIQRRSRLS